MRRLRHDDTNPEQPTPGQHRKRSLEKHWIWPVGLALAAAGSAATLLFRGCWHTHMSWPIAHDGEFSYQVCTNCGIKRLYDEKTFHAYGPYGYDLHELIARERLLRKKRQQQAEERRVRAERKAAGQK